MILKFKLVRFTAIFIATLFILTGCSVKVDNEDDPSIVKGVNYDQVIEQGFQGQGLSLQDILYEKTIGESKIIFFTSHKALGLAYMGKDKDCWTYSRITALYDFKSDSNPPSFMAGGTEVETPDGMKYFLAMGKIFNPEITKITLSNNSVNAIIKEKDGTIFWFQLLDNKDLNNNIKAYDKNDKQLY
jgi:hypothetical protein